MARQLIFFVLWVNLIAAGLGRLFLLVAVGQAAILWLLCRRQHGAVLPAILAGATSCLLALTLSSAMSLFWLESGRGPVGPDMSADTFAIVVLCHTITIWLTSRRYLAVMRTRLGRRQGQDAA